MIPDVVLGAAVVALIAERWHLVNKVTELAEQAVRMHGDRVRIVAPPKQAVPPPGGDPALDGHGTQEAHR